MCQLMTKAWFEFKDSTKRFLQYIIGEYAVEYPNVCDIIMTLI